MESLEFGEDFFGTKHSLEVAQSRHGAMAEIIKNAERNKRLTPCQKSEREPDVHVIRRVDPRGLFPSGNFHPVFRLL